MRVTRVLWFPDKRENRLLWDKDFQYRWRTVDWKKYLEKGRIIAYPTVRRRLLLPPPRLFTSQQFSICSHHIELALPLSSFLPLFLVTLIYPSGFFRPKMIIFFSLRSFSSWTLANSNLHPKPFVVSNRVRALNIKLFIIYFFFILSM
jgi:hypothetical protein